MQNKKEAIQNLLMASAEEHPNCIVVDLLAHFSPETVMKIIELYSGERLFIPKVETIWKNYRNKVIRDMLDAKNTRVIREQLSQFFKISLNYVTVIYGRSHLKVRKVKTNFVNDAARRIYIDESDSVLKEIQEALSGK